MLIDIVIPPFIPLFKVLIFVRQILRHFIPPLKKRESGQYEAVRLFLNAATVREIQKILQKVL